ncbi:MAG: DUF6788 family protein [Verrucomicrobiota bacterium]
MDCQKRRRQILKEVAQIDCMEKGRLSEEYRERHKDGQKVRLGPYYKHQQWEEGHNVSRRVAMGEVEHLRKAVDGYHEFKALCKEYAEITIEMTRQASRKDVKKKPR